jgi:hypothetical protein
MSAETTTETPGPPDAEAPPAAGDFSPPRVPRGKLSLVRIYTGGFLLLFIGLAWAATPRGAGAAPAFLVCGFSAYHVLFRRASFWWPARPNPFRRRAMTGFAALGVAAAAALAIALPGAAVIGVIWAILTALRALQNRFGLDHGIFIHVGALVIPVGAVAATCASYLVARRLFPPTTDA